MVYSPKRNKKGFVASAALLAIFAVMSASSPAIENYGGIVSAVSLLFLVASLFLMIRYCISKYAYEITSETLVITKITGQRKTIVASMLLITALGVEKTPETNAERAALVEKYGKIDAKMDCRTNLFAKTYSYITEFNGAVYEIKIEADEPFAEALRNAVADARRRSGENDL